MNTNRAVTITFFLLRVVAALIFFQAGAMKLFAWYGGMPGTPPGFTATFPSQVWFGGVLEVFGGLALGLGLFTRPVAFLLSGEMAVAYWQFHAPRGTWPIQNHGESAVLFCFLWLFVAAYGGGEWSLDAVLRRARRKSA